MNTNIVIRVLATIISVFTIGSIVINSIGIHHLHETTMDAVVGRIHVITWFRAALSFSVLSLVFGLLGLNNWTNPVASRGMGAFGILISSFLIAWSIIGFMLAHRETHSTCKALTIGSSSIFLVIVILALFKSSLMLRYRETYFV